MKPTKLSHLKQHENQDLIWSLALHIAVIAAFSIKTYFFDKSISYIPSVRVDIVALPEKQKPNANIAPIATKQDTKVLEPSKKELPVLKDETAIKLDKKTPSKDKNNQEKQKNAIERLKALEKLQQDLKRQNQQNEAINKLKGNAISKGQSRSADLTGLDRVNYSDYIGELDNHVKANWQIPAWLANQQLKARARLRIDSQGNVLEKKIISSSGNPEYDNAVLNSIMRGAPYPAPPENLAGVLEAEGIVLGFPE